MDLAIGVLIYIFFFGLVNISLFLLFGSTTIILVLGLMSIRHFASCIRRFNCRRSESVFFCFLLEVNSAQLCERRYFHLIPQFLS